MKVPKNNSDNQVAALANQALRNLKLKWKNKPLTKKQANKKGKSNLQMMLVKLIQVNLDINDIRKAKLTTENIQILNSLKAYKKENILKGIAEVYTKENLRRALLQYEELT